MKDRLDFLLKLVKNEFTKISDYRAPGKTLYALPEILLDNLMLFIELFPSFREFKLALKNSFGITSQYRCGISSSQSRDVVDHICSTYFRPTFLKLFSYLQRSKILENYVFYQGQYLMPIDGSGYFSSLKIHCDSCLTRKGRYQHQVLQPFIAHPNQDVLIPLMPEEISNTDGSTKQDCEINAAKRLISSTSKEHPKLKLIILGDGIYSTQPFIEHLRAHNMSYICVVKPGNHKSLFEDLQGLQGAKSTTKYKTFQDGVYHEYEWVNNISLNANKESIKVNFFSYTQKTKSGKTIYYSSWVTDFIVCLDNVRDLCRGGKCRWKCEADT